MLRQTICTVCEKVIVTADGQTSLINLFTKLTGAVPPEAEIPKNAVAPKEWAVFAAWESEPADELKDYMMCVQMLYPDGSQFGNIARQKIKIELDKRSQVTANVNAFPMGQEGTFTVRVWVELNQERVLEPTDIRIQVEVTRTPVQPTAV